MKNSPFDAIPDVDFVPRSVDALLAEMTADYEEAYHRITGEHAEMEPSTPERIFLYTEALRFYAAYRLIDRGCKMNLLKYSEGDYLDNLAAMVGEARLPAQKAVTTLRFTLSAPQASAILIPRGTRATAPGKLYFATRADLIIPAGETVGECPADACEPGAKLSGLQPGAVNQIVDPVAFVASVSNAEVTQGGVDVETDDSLRLRVYLKPKSFSVAGPEEAYRYFVQAYSQAIEGISVTSPAPGEVDIRITLRGGEMPTESFISGLAEFLQGKRPLTDRVSIAPPDVAEYTLRCTYYVAKSNPNKLELVTSAINQAGQNYLAWQSSRIGRDLTPDKLTSLLVAAGAKRVHIESPVYTPVPETSICKCASAEILFGGVEDD